MSRDEQTAVHDAHDDVDATDVVPPVLDDDAYLFDPLETPVPASLEGEAAPAIPTGYAEGNAHDAEKYTDALGADTTSIITQVIPQRSLAPEVLPFASSLGPQNLALAALAVAILLVSVLVLFTKRRSATKGNALLLVGPPDAGKSAILSALVYKHTLPTHASLQTNSAFATLPNLKQPLRVIDVPGHPRVRDQFRAHLPEARAVAFVVDASTVSRNGARVAEHLHTLLRALSHLPPSQPTPALAILAHKSDLLKAGAPALAASRVRTVLERELERRRAAAVEGIAVEGMGSGGDLGGGVGIGRAGDDAAQEENGGDGLECSGSGVFSFDTWEGGEVTFLGSSTPVGKGDGEKEQQGLADLEAWLEEHFA
ncbi:signal recognition particle receptor beta subunit-domain-containing protein [Schizophyllum commune]